MYDLFLSSPVMVYTKTIFLFPFALCERKGKEHNPFPLQVALGVQWECTERNGHGQVQAVVFLLVKSLLLGLHET